ncbi:hypothetical protein IFR05_009967 [Cadophora sp. M221]|nr:hypothetical protein IFR05_009967 [Cadophora sp. M221]
MYDWYCVILLLASFVGFITEEHAISYLSEARGYSYDEVLDYIMSLCPHAWLHELSMTRESLANRAHIALGMKRTVKDYDSQGMVGCMDVFYAKPMLGYGPAANVEDCYDRYISKWDAFVKKDAKYYLMEGDHKTMINSLYVDRFQKLFKRVLEKRGL